MIGLTGTPAPNGLIDLWAQIYLLDRGERLGRTLTGFRDRYFRPGQRSGHVVYSWVPKPEAEAAIHHRLSDLCISMQAADYLQLPDRLDRIIQVRLSPDSRAAYQTMERDMVLPLREGEITAASAAVVMGKLMQLASGAIYDEDRTVHEIHSAKLDALGDLLETANGQPVLVMYGYKHDRDRIIQRFPDARLLETAEDIQAWNRGEVQLMLAHPDSAGHGLNLQAGGHIMIWYTLTWSLEKYQQANARLHRQGQRRPVTIYHLVAADTVDEDAMRALAGKATGQQALMDAVKARIANV